MLTTEWENFSPNIHGDTLDVPCKCCPKYRSFPPRCIVSIGTRLRSCVVASIEYHFRNVKGKNILEVGCGENSFARTIIELCGGKWTGLDPRAGSRGKSSIRSIAGEVHHIPVIDNYFDIVMGIQTIEHWPRNHSLESDPEYEKALSEIWRILKPGGSIYFDAPIFLHGAPEFIIGDIEGIKRFFLHQTWINVTVTSWRKSRGLIRKKIACREERNQWPQIFHHDKRILDELRGKSTYIISITADKPVF
jgi:SAM-dependent methyltransferase